MDFQALCNACHKHTLIIDALTGTGSYVATGTLKPQMGRGIAKGLFFEMNCPGFNSGGVDKQTGQALDPEALVLELRMRLNDRANTITRLEQQLADLEPYRRQKQQADLAKTMYQRGEVNDRPRTRRGGYGD